MNGNRFIWCVLTGDLSEFVQVNLPFLYPKKTHSNARKNFGSVKGHMFLFGGYCCPLEAISQLSQY